MRLPLSDGAAINLEKAIDEGGDVCGGETAVAADAADYCDCDDGASVRGGMSGGCKDGCAAGEIGASSPDGSARASSFVRDEVRGTGTDGVAAIRDDGISVCGVASGGRKKGCTDGNKDMCTVPMLSGD